MAKERDSFRGPDGRAGTASLAPAGGPTERAGLLLSDTASCSVRHEPECFLVLSFVLCFYSQSDWTLRPQCLGRAGVSHGRVRGVRLGAGRWGLGAARGRGGQNKVINFYG